MVYMFFYRGLIYFSKLMFLAKAVKVMLESCVKLGGTLLEQWTPEGKKRGSKSEKEFKNDVEDFFETAKCTRFDKDIQVDTL